MLPIEPLIGGLILISTTLTYSDHNYWTPYRGIDTVMIRVLRILGVSIEPLIGGLIRITGRQKFFLIFISIEPLIGGLIRLVFCLALPIINYWTPYRGIDTIIPLYTKDSSDRYWTPYRGIDTWLRSPAIALLSIEPLIGGLIHFRVITSPLLMLQLLNPL